MPIPIRLNVSREDMFAYWRSQLSPSFPHFEELVKSHPFLNTLIEKLYRGTGFFILNHMTGSWEFVSEGVYKVSGYPPEKFTEKGYDFSFTKMHPGYIDFIFQLSHKIVFDYLYSIPVDERKLVTFSKDFLYLSYNGEYIRILQRGIVLECEETGGILRTLHFVSDITHLKKEGFSNLVIEMPRNKFKVYTFDCEKVYFIEHTLNRREIEMLQLLSKQLSSKQIAEKLFISPHTADTHRRNLLNKFNCVNTTALVTYAKMLEII